MKITIPVENIKCGGCASSIKKGLISDKRISEVEVDIEKGVVSIESNEPAKNEFTAILLKMGYPEIGTAEGIAAAKAKAKSLVSCAIGKVDNVFNK